MSEAASRRIPDVTVERLPVYRRAAMDLLSAGMRAASSDLLAKRAGVSAATLRKDLSYLGSFGTRGSGYELSFLLGQVDRQLGLDRAWPIAIIGIGNLGRALASAPGFAGRGFRVAALLDVDPHVVGQFVNGIEILHLEELPRMADKSQIAIGVITTPARAAQEVAGALEAVHTMAILNFAPVVLQVGKGVAVRNVELATELQILSFHRLHRF